MRQPGIRVKEYFFVSTKVRLLAIALAMVAWTSAWSAVTVPPYINPPASIDEDSSAQYTARYANCTAINSNDCDATNDVVWSIDSGPPGVSITSSGLLTVGAVGSAATVTVRATYQGYLWRTDTETINNTVPTLLGFRQYGSGAYQSQDTAYLNKGTPATFYIKGIWDQQNPPAGIDNLDMAWSFPASYGSISVKSDNSIILTPAASLASNVSATLTATRPASIPGANYSPTLASNVGTPIKIRVKIPQNYYIQGSNSVDEGNSASFSAKIIWNDNSSSLIPSPAWSVDCCGSISSSGLLTVNQVTSDVATTVRAAISQASLGTDAPYYPDVPSTTLSYPVTIKNTTQLNSLSITTVASVPENSATDLDATALYSDNSTKSVNATWSVTNPTDSPNLASFSASPNGLLNVGPVGHDETITITATYTDGNTKSQSEQITVTNGVDTLESLRIVKDDGSAITSPVQVNEGGLQGFKALASFNDGRTDVDVSTSSTWSISGLSNAFINSSGMLFTYGNSAGAGAVSAAYTDNGTSLSSTADVKVDGQNNDLGPLVLVSNSPDGSSAGNDDSRYRIGISGNNRYLVYSSYASNIVPGASGWLDIYRYDTTTDSNELVSKTYDGGFASNNSLMPDISDDGRYVVFFSSVPNLVGPSSATFTATQVYIRDMETGTTREISREANGQAQTAQETGPAISGNGQYVVYQSATEGIWLWDAASDTTRVLSSDATADASTGALAIDHNGQYVAYVGWVGEGIYLIDTTTNAESQISEGVPSSSRCASVSMSDDGRYVTFGCSGTNGNEIYIYDTAAQQLKAISGKNGVAVDGVEPMISGNGRYIAFSSPSNALVEGDTDDLTDVFVYDVLSRVIHRVSVTETGGQATGGTNQLMYPSIGEDGSVIAFVAQSSGLSPLATGLHQQVYAKTVTVSDPAPRVWLQPVNDQVQIGSPVEYDLYMDFSQVAANATVGGSIDISYDPSVLSFSSFDFDSFGGDSEFTLQPDTSTPGALIGLSFGSFSGLSGASVGMRIGRLTFNSIGLANPNVTVAENTTTLGGYFSAATYTPLLVFYEGSQVAIAGQLPVAVDATIDINEDQAYTGTLNSTNPNGGTLSYSLVSPPTKGVVQITDPGTGAFTYTPYQNDSGSDVFTFQANDGYVNSNMATVTIAIAAVNDPPVADAGINVSVFGGSTVALNGGGSSDVDGAVSGYAWQQTSGPAVTLAGASTATPNFAAPSVATDTVLEFQLVVTDDQGAESSPATVQITVKHANAVPVANPDSAAISKNAEAALIDVLGNDSDADNDPLAVESVTQPANGAAAVANGATNVTYTPNTGYTGSDSFAYTVSDGKGGTATGTVSVTVENDPPTADSQSQSTNEDTAIALILTGADPNGDSLTFSVGTAPSHGTLGAITQADATSAQVTYTPNANYYGPDSFTFVANDGFVDSGAATVSLTVNPVNNPPVANADSATINENSSSITIDVLSNDTDADGNSLTVTAVTQPSHGTAAVGSGGANVAYVPSSNYSGSDSFTYTVSDGNGGTATGAVSVSVVAQPPVADGQSQTTDEDTAITLTLTGSDSGGNALTFTVPGYAAHGTLSSVTQLTSTSAQVTYTPSSNYNGSDSFSFTVDNGTTTSSAAVVSLTINAVNDAPTAADSQVMTGQDAAVKGLAQGSDVEKDSLSFSVVSNGSLGTAEFTDPRTGLFTYTPNSGASGTDTFTFKANDGQLDSTTHTVTVLIAAAGTTYTVTKTANTNDGTCDSDCSLAEAVAAANASPGYDTISIPAGTYPVADLSISDAVKLQGAGAGSTILDASTEIDHAIQVQSGVLADISGVTIQNGQAVDASSDGGAIFNQGDTHLSASVVSGNTGLYGGIRNMGNLVVDQTTVIGNCGPYGGGIWNGGGGSFSAIVIDSTVSDSGPVGACTDGGGGIHFSGGYGLIDRSTISGNATTGSSEAGGMTPVSATVYVINSTIASNTGVIAGGISNQYSMVELTNATVAHNAASQNGGGIGDVGSSSDLTRLVNTLVAQNSAASGSDCYATASGRIVSGGHNLIGDTTGCQVDTAAGDQYGAAASLDTYTDDGTPGRGYYPLLSGSTAIDAGDDSLCEAVDQRGYTRPADGNGDSVSTCDIGAYEYNASAPGGGNTLSWSETILETGQSGDGYGEDVAAAGDVNGDGYADLLVAAYQSPYTVDLYFGSSNGYAATPDVTLQNPNPSVYKFGYKVAGAGDVNGDGYGDILIGAPGVVYLYYGSASGPSSAPDWTLTDISRNELGYAVASAGDINRDGYDDVILGEPGYWGTWANEGRVFVYMGSAAGLGSTPTTLYTDHTSGDSNSYFGLTLADAGDVNGDGFEDIVIGAPGFFSKHGKASVYLGSAQGISQSPVWSQQIANLMNSYAEMSVGTAGDVNGDGYADIIVGQDRNEDLGATNGGKVSVYYGSANGPSSQADWTIYGASGDLLGARVGAAEDVNSDGFADILIGSAEGPSRTGEAAIYYGSSVGLDQNQTPAWVFTPDPAGGMYGSFACTLGDANGDGVPDIAIGAPVSTGDTNPGRVFVEVSQQN